MGKTLGTIAFRKFAKDCPYRVEIKTERRPANALNVEIGSPADRCSLKIPENWKQRNLTWARWVLSGGQAFVLGYCSRNCALGHKWCDECGHRIEHHIKGMGCIVDDGGWPCGCEAKLEPTPAEGDN